MANHLPKIQATPDMPIITIRRPKDEITLELVAQWARGYPLGTHIRVLCVNHAETQLLHERLFQVVSLEPFYTTTEREAGSHGEAGMNSMIVARGEWWASPFAEAAETKPKKVA